MRIRRFIELGNSVEIRGAAIGMRRQVQPSIDANCLEVPSNLNWVESRRIGGLRTELNESLL